MLKKKKGFLISRETYFVGKRKIGIDTNILIKLYIQPALFNYEEARIFNRSDIIFTHRLCFMEFVRYLIKRGINKEEAKQQAKNFLNSHNIKELCHFISEEEIKNFEKDCNKKFKQMNKERLRCHIPDSIILLAFKKADINKIISTDESFRECAKFLGMDSESLPSLDYSISRELKRIFDYKKKFHKRIH